MSDHIPPIGVSGDRAPEPLRSKAEPDPLPPWPSPTASGLLLGLPAILLGCVLSFAAAAYLDSDAVLAVGVVLSAAAPVLAARRTAPRGATAAAVTRHQVTVVATCWVAAAVLLPVAYGLLIAWVISEALS